MGPEWGAMIARLISRNNTLEEVRLDKMLHFNLIELNHAFLNVILFYSKSILSFSLVSVCFILLRMLSLD